jgi:hypothetical protein
MARLKYSIERWRIKILNNLLAIINLQEEPKNLQLNNINKAEIFLYLKKSQLLL